MIAAVAERLAIVAKCSDGMEHGFKYPDDTLPVAYMEYDWKEYDACSGDV